jgi:hypothetical protein
MLLNGQSGSGIFGTFYWLDLDCIPLELNSIELVRQYLNTLIRAVCPSYPDSETVNRVCEETTGRNEGHPQYIAQLKTSAASGTNLVLASGVAISRGWPDPVYESSIVSGFVNYSFGELVELASYETRSTLYNSNTR